MGAIRRLQLKEEERQHFDSSDSAEELRESPYPRWIVVSGVILYCAAFWAVIWVAASNGLAWVRTAAAGAQ